MKSKKAVGEIASLQPKFANDTPARSLADACEGADVFIGLSGANLLMPEILQSMAPRPVVFACSNPDPEIAPELAWETRDDIIMATGRSDYPNQVNNVLCFPYIFRGALDVGATTINEEMKLACVRHGLHGESFFVILQVSLYTSVLRTKQIQVELIAFLEERLRLS